jgi:pimeloyl-ACP methyl ester carboxylesterase
MNSSADSDLASRYRQFCLDYPLQQASLEGCQDWAWVDTLHGDRTIVLLPGLMGEAGTSFLYIQALAPHLRVVSVTYPSAIGSVSGLCSGLHALLDFLKIKKASILGGSASGFLAQAFVRSFPEHTSSLILTHTGLPNSGRARSMRRYLWLLRMMPFGLLRTGMLLSVPTYFPRRTPMHAFWREHFRQVIRRQGKSDLQKRFSWLADFHSHYHFQPGDLAAWQGKILLMEMHGDTMTSPSEQAAMRALYPGAHLHVFSEAGHFDSVEKPEAQIEVIRNFLLSWS